MKSEIEVKAKVNDSNNLIHRLKEIGCVLSSPIIQDDFIFNQSGIDLRDHSHNTPVLRIREQKERVIFTVKKNRSNELDCIEKEVDVNNKNMLEEIIKLLGFKKTIEVHKKRRKGNYRDYEICLDEVEGLGTYIEIEKMSEEDGNKVQNELCDFLKELGVKIEDRVLLGYDTLIYLKNNPNY
jgi:adenylate cyclase, class 2